jgi:hypothetical protein
MLPKVWLELFRVRRGSLREVGDSRREEEAKREADCIGMSAMLRNSATEYGRGNRSVEEPSKEESRKKVI